MPPVKKPLHQVGHVKKSANGLSFKAFVAGTYGPARIKRADAEEDLRRAWTATSREHARELLRAVATEATEGVSHPGRSECLKSMKRVDKGRFLAERKRNLLDGALQSQLAPFGKCFDRSGKRNEDLANNSCEP